VAGLEIHPFSDEFRGEAAELLRERHERHRAGERLLPAIDDYAAQLPEGDGAVATRGGRVVAYAVADVGADRAAVGLAGCAAMEPEALRDVYASLAAGWPPVHQVMVPASDAALLDPWFRLAFGCQFVTGVREPAREELVDFGGTIRPANPSDLHTLAELEELLWELQAGPPSYSNVDLPTLEVLEDEWREVWDEPERYWVFVAERAGRSIGAILMYLRPTGDLRIADGNVDLAFAATRPDVRGSGVGLALTRYVLAWAVEQGFRSVTADWRSVNLLSSRFWPARGFRPTFLRLCRSVA